MERLSEFGKDLWIDCIGSLCIAISLYVFALNANFAPGGVNGLSLIINHMFGLPIGAVSLVINIPIILLSYKFLGKRFLLCSLKTMFISALFMDFIAPMLPIYSGDRLLSSIFTGAIGGVGYALIYMRQSSTGGSDFLIMSAKKLFPHKSIGQITQMIDGSVILVGLFVFGNIEAVLYGILSTIISTIVVDKLMYGAHSGKLLYIISTEHELIAFKINEIVSRGSTYLHATGAYKKNEFNLILCACSRNQVYSIKRMIETIDSTAIMIITESNEVYGSGFIEFDRL